VYLYYIQVSDRIPRRTVSSWTTRFKSAWTPTRRPTCAGNTATCVMLVSARMSQWCFSFILFRWRYWNGVKTAYTPLFQFYLSINSLKTSLLFKLDMHVHSNKFPTPPFSIWHCMVNRSCNIMKFHYNTCIHLYQTKYCFVQ